MTALLERDVVAVDAGAAVVPARRRGFTLGAVAAAVVALAGLIFGLQPLSDNSFLTHLATGRLLLHGSIPRVDPFSFTAAGAHWVDQSWLPELLYGLLDKLGGGTALVLFHGAFLAGLALLLWRLTRPGATVAVRLLTVILLLGVGIRMWTTRPLLFGLLCLGLTILVTDEDRSPTWLLPIGWLWVNSHGSFPLGLVYLGARLIGCRLDGRATGRLRSYAAWLAAGCALGAVGPVGPSILLFPLHLLGRHAALSHVVEWRTADFGAPVNLAFLLLSVGVLVGGRRRPLEHLVPAAVFVVLGVMALRNIGPAAIVLTPLLARSVRVRGACGGGSRRAPGGAIVVGLVGALSVLLVVRAASTPAYDLSGYPVHELSWMKAHGLLDGRVAAPDYVGNYQEWAEGPHHQVFQDDRFDLFPMPLLDAAYTLSAARPGWDAALDQYRIDTVLWPVDYPLASLLSVDPHWRVVLHTRAWVVATRR